MNLNELIEKLQTLQANGKGRAKVNYFSANFLETVKRVRIVEPYCDKAAIILDTCDKKKKGMTVNKLVETLQIVQKDNKGYCEVNYFNAHILETVKTVKIADSGIFLNNK